MHVYILDLIGVFAFAVFGSYKALEKRLNIYGVIACAALTALGGGTIRELIVHQLPIYFVHHMYLYVTLFGAMSATFLYRHFSKIRQYALVIDAIGLTTFTYIGADRASAAGLGLVGMVFFAVLTAAGGGIVADLVVGNKPGPFVDELYILPAVIGGCLYWVLGAGQLSAVDLCVVLAVPFGVRVGWLFRKGELRFFLTTWNKLSRLAGKLPIGDAEPTGEQGVPES